MTQVSTHEGTELAAPEAVAQRCEWITEQVHRLGRRGAVVQLSGGIDSTVVLHLCARALGTQNVVALYLPDTSTGPDTLAFVEAAASNAGVRLVERSIGASIEAQQPIERINELIRKYEPGYDPATHAYSVNAANNVAKRLGALVYEVAIGPRHGSPEKTLRMSVEDLRALIAYQNRKQRTRMLFAYAEAEALGYAVVGASNGDELDTGFVVKYGDDAADICAIGDLTKPAVYAFARELGVPQQIIERTPTTDTYALAQSQEDYYYALPADVLRQLVGDGESVPSDEAVQAALEHAPGWKAAALRQAATGLAASLRYQRTRSLRP